MENVILFYLLMRFSAFRVSLRCSGGRGVHFFSCKLYASLLIPRCCYRGFFVFTLSYEDFISTLVTGVLLWCS